MAETVCLQEMLVVFVEQIHRKSICLCKKHPQWLHKSALNVHMINCDSHATFALVCLLCMERDLVCNTLSMAVIHLIAFHVVFSSWILFSGF